MKSEADILADIERFRATHGVPETTFGRKAAADPNLIAGLRAGRELRRSTERRVREYMDTYVAEQVSA